MLLLTAGCTGPEPTDRPGDDASLTDLAIAGVELRPSFRPDITAYMVGFDELGQPAELTATPTDARATVELPSLGGVAPGDRLAVEVVSADGSARRTYTVVLLPPDFPELEATVAGPSSGFTWLGTAPSGRWGAYAMIVDPNGVPDWYARFEGTPWDFRRAPTGEPTCVTWRDGRDVGLVLDPVTGVEVRRIGPVQTAAGVVPRMDVHELAVEEDGSAWVLGTVVEPADLSPWGGPASAEVVHHVVQHLDPDRAVTFEWSSEGAVDYDAVPVWVDDPLYDGAWVYGHANSVAVDPADGNVVVSLRVPSQALKVATAETVFRGRTYAPGEVIWRLGGADSDFAFVGDDRADGWKGFAGQHTVRPVGDGRWIVFDNALRREATGPTFEDPQVVMSATGAPRLAEYVLDTEAMTATLVAAHPWPREVPVVAGGSVQRLADGHTLIGWGNLPVDDPGPAVTEVDADGEVVAELTLPAGVWSYRAWRFE